MRADAAKVSCSTVPFGGSGVSAPEREHYRGWWHLACQFPRGRDNFFYDTLSSRAVASFFLRDDGIYDVLARSVSDFSNTIEDGGP